MRTEKENHRATDSDRTFILGIYQEFCRLMFFTAQKYLSDPLQQEEVVQESLSKLIEKVDTLRTLQPAVLASYIVATVRNTAISLLRAQAQQGQVVSLETLDGEPASQESMDEALILQEELAPPARHLASTEPGGPAAAGGQISSGVQQRGAGRAPWVSERQRAHEADPGPAESVKADEEGRERSWPTVKRGRSSMRTPCLPC